MPQPQPGIILVPSEHARFVIFRVSEIKKSARIMAKCVGSIPASTAHIRRVVIEENGEELQIVRHSFPYGTVSEAGLFFIAYTRDLAIPERMLRRMMGSAGDGLHDHLMDCTQAVSGANFFAPSLRVLKLLAAR